MSKEDNELAILIAVLRKKKHPLKELDARRNALLEQYISGVISIDDWMRGMTTLDKASQFFREDI